MNDRKLLEMAAKAAEFEVKPHSNHKTSPDLVFMYRGKNWNPLTDDGDALRLAVKLRLPVYVDGNMTDVDGCTEAHFGDPYAATRRAIVRAAAEIGKAIQ